MPNFQVAYLALLPAACAPVTIAPYDSPAPFGAECAVCDAHVRRGEDAPLQFPPWATRSPYRAQLKQQERLWIKALYTDVLGRAPDACELDYWIACRDAGASLESIVKAFQTSEDAALARASSCYRDFLGREGEPAGLRGWIELLEQGTPVQDVMLGFLDSDEYRAKHPAPQAFVESLYRHLLGRAPEPAGMDRWVAALERGTSSADVVRGLLSSEEYCSKRVTELYLTLLGRKPEPAGLAGWVRGARRGMAWQEIERGFLTSAEYRARVFARKL